MHNFTLNNKLLVKALTAYKASIETQDGSEFDRYFELKRIDAEIEKLTRQPINQFVLASAGGQWLGAARTWMQCKATNGERVTWGSDDLLQGVTLTPRIVEGLAAIVASAAINEFKGFR